MNYERQRTFPVPANPEAQRSSVADPLLDRTQRRAGVSRVAVIVVGASTGGPSALERMLPALPQNFPIPVVIAQHMPSSFTATLAARLNRVCQMPVAEAPAGAAIRPGTIWLAPGDMHLEITAGALIKLHKGVLRKDCGPSVDFLFESAAACYGNGTLAVVLTGMGLDGLEGARAVRQAGGIVLAQDRASSAVWGMPGRIAREGLATAVVALPQLAAALLQRVRPGKRVMHLNQKAEVRQEGKYGLL